MPVRAQQLAKHGNCRDPRSDHRIQELCHPVGPVQDGELIDVAERLRALGDDLRQLLLDRGTV
jgi:hypothetical protein